LIENLISVVKDHKIIYGIHTKLLQIQDRLIDLLVTGGREGEDYISISLDAGDSATYNQVHSIPRGNVFEKVLDNIRRIAQAGKRGLPKIVATYLLDDNNSDEETLSKVIERCSQIGVEYLRFSIPQLPYCSNGDGDYGLISMKKLSDAREFIQKQQKVNSAPLEILFTDFPHESITFGLKKRVLPCHARWMFPAIGIDGFLYPCCQVATEEFKELRIADLSKVGFWDSFYAYEYQKDRMFMLNSNCKCDRKALEVNTKLRDI